MNTKHTPGPWSIDSDGDGKPDAIITSQHLPEMDDDVCEVYGGNDDDCETRKANAALIAAAPDLLEALHAIIAKFESDPDDLETMDAGIAIARAAIAKAAA